MITPEQHIRLYKEMLRIRCAEAALAERYKQQEMRTPTHFGLGQEAVPVGVCAALTKEDVAYSHHRSHNHYLAKGGSVYRLAAELFGRKTGCSGGRGGSVHLTDRESGFIASSAILAECVAMATGSALSFAMDASDRIAVAFFGDAVAEEGAFYECLGYAALKKLPVLFVCENNGYATESPLSIRQPEGASIHGRVASFQIPTRNIDGNDVAEVYLTALEVVDEMRRKPGPVFMECRTYRWLEHVGPFFDHELKRTYRTKEEVEEWMAHCPVKRHGAYLLENGHATGEQLSTWETETRKSIEDDIERAYQDPWPDVQTLMDKVY
ncbi:MAG: thiamine pyrophosphate-dependent dehydrogenase E1 component subunit alpha [Acidobacteriota bacterium]|nr:thiamine pyrophosphate-dependent dehydrogenase E1 component subunit alpha [Acidobacteriota bacterium]